MESLGRQEGQRVLTPSLGNNCEREELLCYVGFFSPDLALLPLPAPADLALMPFIVHAEPGAQCQLFGPKPRPSPLAHGELEAGLAPAARYPGKRHVEAGAAEEFALCHVRIRIPFRSHGRVDDLRPETVGSLCEDEEGPLGCLVKQLPEKPEGAAPEQAGVLCDAVGADPEVSPARGRPAGGIGAVREGEGNVATPEAQGVSAPHALLDGGLHGRDDVGPSPLVLENGGLNGGRREGGETRISPVARPDRPGPPLEGSVGGQNGGRDEVEARPAPQRSDPRDVAVPCD